jgi:hypothetical protein
MSETYAQKFTAFLNDLRALAQQETGERRRSALKIIAKLEQQQPQQYASEAHAALGCRRCGYLPCRCGVPLPPTLNHIVALQEQRRGTRYS